jgi:hypothetical protein
MSWSPTPQDVADRYGDARTRVAALVDDLSRTARRGPRRRLRRAAAGASPSCSRSGRVFQVVAETGLVVSVRPAAGDRRQRLSTYA